MQTLKAALLVILGAILLTLSGQSNWALAQQSSPLLFVENVGQLASDESSQFQARLDIFDLTFIASRYNSTLSRPISTETAWLTFWT